jgi:hypothetical protein
MARKAAVQINAKAILVDLPELGPGAHLADMDCPLVRAAVQILGRFFDAAEYSHHARL